MKKIYSSAAELIGRTPMVGLSRIAKKFGLDAEIIAKLELFNPAGSAKDRVALEMLDDAERRGLINKDSVIIEPTSGNTGIGLAMVASLRGYKAIIVMPDSMSEERRRLMRAYGAELILTPGALGMQGACDEAERLRSEHSNSIIAGQFDNPANPAAHYKTTGPEIWSDTEGDIDFFVAGVGTGGSISGVGKYLKEKNPNVKIIAVEPASSPLISKGEAGKHAIQGIGANFIPENYHPEVVDEVIAVSNEEAFEMGRALARDEGILAGISSGAALAAAIEIAKRSENRGKKIAVLLPDSGSRYLSGEMFS